MNLFGEQFRRGVLCDPVTAVIGGISAGTKIIGGIMGKKSAKSAAQIQADAAAAAAKKVEDATTQVNPQIIEAARKAGTGVIDSATSANKLLDPYAKAGGTAAEVLNAGIAQGGDFNKNPTMADIQIDPGYAFRRDQGVEALTRSAAAHGGVGGGGFVKDLNNYVQGSASQEYQAAFDRFQKSTQNRFANVSGVAGMGQDAVTRQGDNFIGANKFAGAADIDAVNRTTDNTLDSARIGADYGTQGANAQAAGKVAGTNALWGGISGAADSALSTVLLTRPANNYINPQGGLGRRGLPRPPRIPLP